MRKLAASIALVAAAQGVGAAQAPWLEVRSAHFTVLTNASEKAGRRVAWQFEQIRAALETLWPWAKLDTRQPFLVYAARDEATLRQLGPQYWEGKHFHPASFSVGSRTRQFVALRVDLREPEETDQNPYQQAYESYVAAVFGRAFPTRLPAWYSRGMAEVLSNTVVRDKEIRVGLPHRQNLREIRERAQVPAGEFFGARRGSPWLTREGAITTFDAQAWATVHYLMFGERGAHREKLDRLNRLLLAGTDADTAIARSLGDLRELLAATSAYVTRSIFQYARVAVALGVEQESFPVRQLSAADAALARAELLVAEGRPVEARAAAEEARRADPAAPGPYEIEAALLDREKRREDAKAAYERAAAAGSANPDVYYRLAQLVWVPERDGAANAGLAGLLEKARALRPDDANTLSFLAEIRGDQQQWPEAVALARQAVELDPSESYHRRALARALWNSGAHEEAGEMAGTALATADGEGEEKSARELVDFIARQQAADSARPRPTAGAAAVDQTDTLGRCFEEREAAACTAAMPLLEGECGKGNGASCAALGSLYARGFGTPADPDRALAAYDRGCAAGEKRGCARAALARARQGGGAEHEAAVATLEALCGERIDDACVGWAVLLAGRGGSGERAKARSLFEASCASGNEKSCQTLKSWPR